MKLKASILFVAVIIFSQNLFGQKTLFWGDTLYGKVKILEIKTKDFVKIDDKDFVIYEPIGSIKHLFRDGYLNGKFAFTECGDYYSVWNNNTKSPFIYDNKCNILSQFERFDESDTIKENYVFKYDEKNRRIERLEYTYYTGQKCLKHRYLYTYANGDSLGSSIHFAYNCLDTNKKPIKDVGNTFSYAVKDGRFFLINNLNYIKPIDTTVVVNNLGQTILRANYYKGIYLGTISYLYSGDSLSELQYRGKSRVTGRNGNYNVKFSYDNFGNKTKELISTQEGRKLKEISYQYVYF